MNVQELAERISEIMTEARAPLPERTHPLKPADYIALWHGDEFCDGYTSVLLAHQVMKIRKFATVELLRGAFYPGKSSDEIPELALKHIEAAFEFYDKRRKAEADE